MDDVNDFLNMSKEGKEFKIEVQPALSVHGRLVPKPEPKSFKREVVGRDYGDEYRKAELEDMKKVSLNCIVPSNKLL